MAASNSVLLGTTTALTATVTNTTEHGGHVVGQRHPGRQRAGRNNLHRRFVHGPADSSFAGHDEHSIGKPGRSHKDRRGDDRHRQRCQRELCRPRALRLNWEPSKSSRRALSPPEIPAAWNHVGAQRVWLRRSYVRSHQFDWSFYRAANFAVAADRGAHRRQRRRSFEESHGGDHHHEQFHLHDQRSLVRRRCRDRRPFRHADASAKLRPESGDLLGRFRNGVRGHNLRSPQRLGFRSHGDLHRADDGPVATYGDRNGHARGCSVQSGLDRHRNHRPDDS